MYMRACCMHNVELFLVGESSEMAGKWRDRWPDNERCPHHAPARLFLWRRSKTWSVARGICWRRRLLHATAWRGPPERTSSECYHCSPKLKMWTHTILIALIFFKIHSNIILHLHPGSPKGSLSILFFPQILHLFVASHMHSTYSDHITFHFIPASCFLFLRCRFSARHCWRGKKVKCPYA